MWPARRAAFCGHRVRPASLACRDTRRNRYYGDDAPSYTARYDRVLLRGALRPTGVQLLGAEPLGGSGPRAHYLSDHFGLVARLQLGGSGAAG